MNRSSAAGFAAAAAIVALTLSCGRDRPAASPGDPPSADGRPGHPDGRVFILGLDGADWEIIDRLVAEGRLPNLARLRAEGASGVLRSEEPLLSPIVWTTIATGRSPTDHGIVGFLTARNGQTEPVRSDERRVRAFWNVASDEGVTVGVIGWYASWPAEPVRGFLVSDRVGSHQVEGKSAPVTSGLAWPKEIVPDVEAARDAVDRDVTTAAAARFFSAAAPGGGAEVSIERDRLDTFVGILRTTELYRRLVPMLEARFHPTISAVYFEGTDAVGHLFAEYEPPPLPWTTAEQRAHFGPAFGRYYEYVDGVVGEIASRLDPATTTLLVVSDHGFRTGERRPRVPSRTAYGNQAPLWHRREGIVMLWGRGVRRGAKLPESSIYDVVPTMFRLLDLPIATTLKGRPIEAALAPAVLDRPARTTADFETAGPRQRADAADLPADEQIEKLRALGYVGGGTPAGAAGGGVDSRRGGSGQSGVALNRYNEALVLLDAGRHDEAMARLSALQRDEPNFALGFLGEGLVRLREGNGKAAVPPLERAVALSPRMAVAEAYLGEAYVQCGRSADGRKALERSLEIDASQGRPALLLAEVLLADRDIEHAARWFQAARTLADDAEDRARGCVGLAVVAEERKSFREAEGLYQEALRDAPNLPAALERSGNLELYLGHPERALEPLSRLVAARGDSVPAMTLYARALAGVGRVGDARTQLEKALSVDPKDDDARALMGELSRAGTRR